MMYIFFCGVVPVSAIFAIGVYYYREGNIFTRKRKSPTSVYVPSYSSSSVSPARTPPSIQWIGAPSTFASSVSSSSSSVPTMHVGFAGGDGVNMYKPCSSGSQLNQSQLPFGTARPHRPAPVLPGTVNRQQRSVLIGQMRLVSSTNPELLKASTELHL